ncbi:nuclear transport factor 2 family protein [Ruegeria sp.]|uniref:nuclear transport factor 2 family protein n=1 Tax=Ruegeria sp. TaxID=1879320 RepID=UPI003C79C04A
MTAQAEILELMNKYSYYIDRGEFDAFAELFTHGAWIGASGPAFEGREGVRSFLDNIILYDGEVKTRHVASNIQIEVDEENGTATAQSYMTIFQATKALPLQVIFSGHYFDEYERIDGAWAFRKREIKHPLFGDLTHHLDFGYLKKKSLA